MRLFPLLPVCAPCQVVADWKFEEKRSVGEPAPCEPAYQLIHPHSKHRESPLSLVKNPVSILKKVSN